MLLFGDIDFISFKLPSNQIICDTLLGWGWGYGTMSPKCGGRGLKIKQKLSLLFGLKIAM